MDLTTGQKLSKARLAKGLSIDEVAHATKLRPDKVMALELDDYSRFPSNVYVKGFLQIYGRYLGVDVGAALGQFENQSPISVADYQYLNSVPEKEPDRITLRRKSSKPSLAPLVVFIFLCALVGGGGYIYVNAKRLGNMDQLSSADAPATSPDASVSTPSVAAPPAEPAPKPAPADSPVRPPETPATPVPVANASVSDHEFIAEVPAPNVEDATSATNVVEIEPVRKTWVTVRRGEPGSAPIFEDFLYTNAPALKLHGARFFIEVREEGAVVIRKNGAPIAYQGSGVTIQ